MATNIDKLSELELFLSGESTHAYKFLGSHFMKIGDRSGVVFRVWAPNAMRVSVVGSFNNWDGRIHQMNKAHNVGIFELFIPGVTEGDLYKYEIKTQWGSLMMKTDPFGNYQQKRPDTASIVTDINKYQWTDQEWMEKRKVTNIDTQPVAIYEMHPGSWKRKGEYREEFLTYRELAPMLAEYLNDMGYTHVELTLETGRTHQIRVHMAYIGHPVAGDPVYSGKKYLTKLNGQCLHAYYISFTHPRTNEILAFSAPLPEYFTDFLKSIQ